MFCCLFSLAIFIMYTANIVVIFIGCTPFAYFFLTLFVFFPFGIFGAFAFGLCFGAL